MDTFKRYSQDFDLAMTTRLKGDTIVEGIAIIGISIYLTMFLEKTDSNIRNIVNSKAMIAVAIAGCLTIANHRPVLSMMIAVAYLAVLSATNQKAEAEKFAAFVPSKKPDFVATFHKKMDLTNTQLAQAGNTNGTLNSLYPVSEPIDYVEVSGNKPWTRPISNLPALQDEMDEGRLL